MKQAFRFWLPGLLLLCAVQPLLAQDDDSDRQEQLAKAQAVVSRGERLSTLIAAMKTQAEREQDIIRVTCLNTKLAEVNANVRNAKSRLDKLRAETDPKRRNQAMTVMFVLGQKLDLLDQEANQCIGQQLFTTGTTKVDTTIDNAIVPGDTEVEASNIPTVVPPAETGDVQLVTPPTLGENSPDGDET